MQVEQLHLLEAVSFSAFVRGVRGTAWLEEAVLMALADVLGVPITVVTAQRNHPTMIYTIRPGFGNQAAEDANERVLALGYIGANHYVLIKPK